jgi:hypothetical protein
MATSKRWKDSRDKRDGGAFVAVPLSVLNSVAYTGASVHAKALLWDLCSQLKAGNNGDLCAAWKLMQPRGWKSEETLHKAKGELLGRGLIVESRKGARPNKASLYAVTWRDLDFCEGKLDMLPASFPRGAYRLLDPLPPLKKNASLTTPAVVEKPG